MDRVRNQIGEAVELQGALMRDDRACFAQWQPRNHDLLVRSRGKVAQPVQPAPDPDVATPLPSMVAQGAAVHPGLDGLASGEISGLRLSLPVEGIMVNVMHKGDYIPLTSDDLHPNPLGQITEQNKGPRGAVAIRNGKVVPFDYRAALEMAQEAHMLATGVRTPNAPKPASAPRDR